MYFNRGKLPWQGLRTSTKKKRYDAISQKKQVTTIEALCKGFPEEFAEYLRYCRSLRFDDKPDYTYLRKLFRDLFYRMKFPADQVYDWNTLDYETNMKLPPLMPAEGEPPQAAAAAAAAAAQQAAAHVESPAEEKAGKEQHLEVPTTGGGDKGAVVSNQPARGQSPRSTSRLGSLRPQDSAPNSPGASPGGAHA